MKRTRVMVFVDGPYLYRQVTKEKIRINYYKLVMKVVNNRKLIRPYFYDSVKIPISVNHHKFHKALKKHGFVVITKPLLVRKNVDIIKGIDIAIATDMLTMAFRNLFDVAILVSSDIDFIPTIQEIRKLNKKVELVTFKSMITPILKSHVDKVTTIEDIQEEISFSIGGQSLK